MTSDSPSMTCGLYNAMIHPLVPFAFRGVIWYQGESNADRAEQYRTLLTRMIADWRAAFARDFSFLQVQLAPWMARQAEPRESAWAELREAQTRIASEVGGVHMACIIDSGDAGDIHPRNKALVGHRLARIALATLHARSMIAWGPRLVSHRRDGARMRLVFSDCDGGLSAFGNEPVRGFAIAGADRVFRWAEARIEGDAVVVQHDAIPEPAAVRYAWADNPAGNLLNIAGLPAQPCRTDAWPGVTVGRR